MKIVHVPNKKKSNLHKMEWMVLQKQITFLIAVTVALMHTGISYGFWSLFAPESCLACKNDIRASFLASQFVSGFVIILTLELITPQSVYKYAAGMA